MSLQGPGHKFPPHFDRLVPNTLPAPCLALPVPPRVFPIPCSINPGGRNDIEPLVLFHREPRPFLEAHLFESPVPRVQSQHDELKIAVLQDRVEPGEFGLGIRWAEVEEGNAEVGEIGGVLQRDVVGETHVKQP